MQRVHLKFSNALNSSLACISTSVAAACQPLWRLVSSMWLLHDHQPWDPCSSFFTDCRCLEGFFTLLAWGIRRIDSFPWGQQCWGRGGEFCFLSNISIKMIAFKLPLIHALERTVQDILTCFASWGDTGLRKTDCLSHLGAWLFGMLLHKSCNLPGKNPWNYCLAFHSVCTTC